MNAATPRFHGYVEVVGRDKITGWCVSVETPYEPAELELEVRGEVVARVRTAIDRPDVAKELGGHRLCGYEFLRTMAIPDFGPGEILVRPVGAAVPLSFLDPSWAPIAAEQRSPASAPVAEAPRPAAPPPAAAPLGPPPRIPDLSTLDAALAEAMLLQPFPLAEPEAVPAGRATGPAGPLEGHLDLVVHGEACGWARRRGAGPVRVELRVDGETAGTALANIARPDLAEAGMPPCAFALPLPDRVYDGEPHEIAVLEVGTGEPLRDSPKTAVLRGGGGFFRLRRGLPEGRVVFGDRPVIRLEVLVDGARHPMLPLLVLERRKDPAGWFTIAMPVALQDGAEHWLSVRDAGTGEWLRAWPEGRELPYRAALRGRLERFAGGILTGWVQDPADPAAPVPLVLHDGGRPVTEAVTGLARPEIGPGTPGFALPVPRALFDGALHRLRLTAGGVDLPLDGTREFDARLSAEDADASQLRFRGKVELVSPELVTGWAVDALAPDRPVQLAVELDGGIVATITANRYEPRLLSLSPHGQHGFAWPVPAECWAGRARSLSIRILGAAEPLEGMPTALHPPYRLLPAPAARPAAPVPARGMPAGMVSAIVLNRNGAALLESLFASLAEHVTTPFEVILIDHGSTDDSLAVARRWRRRLPIRIKAREGNFSYSESNNLGARMAKGQHLLFLNNDILLRSNPLPAMLRTLAAKGVAAVGARLAEPVVQPDGSLRPVLHHDGIAFRLLHGGAHARSLWLPYEIEADAADIAAGSGPAPAATAAMLLVRRADFLALGGFDEGYEYGLEDVDLCLRLGREIGSIVVARDAVAVHQRSATRGRRFAAALADPVQQEARGREIGNRQHFLRRQAAWLKRRIRAAALSGEAGWRAAPFRIGFAVTSIEPETSAGDVFTALELAEALTEGEGWEAALHPFKEADIRGLDALVAMRPDTPIRRVVNATPGLVTIAWVRNRVDEWIGSGLLDAYTLVFASSRKAAEAIEAATGLPVGLLPIASNPRRFAPPAPGTEPEADILFTGNHWGNQRLAQTLLDPSMLGIRFVIHGQGWDKVEEAAPYWRGRLPYWEMPAAYGGARLVLDDSDPVTRDWNSLNSRVFDAAASGALVLTNCTGGAEELFPGLLPSFSTAEELNTLAHRYLSDDAARQAAATRLRGAVLAGHTYAHRAKTVAAAVRQAASRLRFGIKVPVPKHDEREAWGDWHFAQGLARALRRLGHSVRLDILPEWGDGVGAGDDVSLVLRGLSTFEPDPHCLNLLWLISHPSKAGVEELAGFDHVFVASAPHAESLRPALGDRVSPLLQCTDPALFHPDPERPEDLAPVVFIGNSRRQHRPVVADAIAAGLDLAVWGRDWEGRLPGVWRGEHIENRLLRRYYSHAEVVLNDHWDDMRAHGFLSNRLFDAAACGAAIVTDRVEGLPEVFGDLVYPYDGAEDLPRAVAAARARQPEAAARLRRLILGKHTFAQRAEAILAVVERHLPGATLQL
ncbi:glycosyltransferase [Belnapia sp. T6]|uniref:Glycosyltransferase n=1 Tax=Belnapia mucosa TaxID=2804532 RepID=A0ABS1VCB0_9PROT|nr:glycosyltransferase [Belnapia mucosa]MBL6459317.1 glycosyltransferase [Belnapia mucosa]